MAKFRLLHDDGLCHVVDAPQEFDEVGAELGSEAQVWKTSVKETNEWDGERVDGWNKTLDVILIFAALFSAISTAFVIESYKSLKEDPADVSAQALRLISQTLVQLANNTQPIALPTQTEIPEFKAPTSAIVVNFLWLLSLSLSVAVSLVAMLAKEWCFTYMSGRTGSPAAQARRRQQRLNGLIRWKMENMLLVLPSFIQIALLLFAVGLSLFLWDVHVLAAIPVAVVTGIALVLYLICTILPFLDTYCPYGTTMTKIFQMIGRNIAGLSVQATVDDQNQDDVTSQGIHWLVTNCETPRPVDIALQSIAGASNDLPVDIFMECDALGLIRKRFLLLDSRSANPVNPLFLYSRAMLYLEGTMHPTYAIIEPLRPKADRLEILLWSMQLQVEGLFKTHWDRLPLGWRQELLDSCKVFTLQATKVLREDRKDMHDCDCDPPESSTSLKRGDKVRIVKVRIVNLALTVFKQAFLDVLESALAKIEGIKPMMKRELVHVVFSLFLTSILGQEQCTLHRIDFPMCLLRMPRQGSGNEMFDDELALTLAALALSRQDYPGWINPCPFSHATRIERTVDFLLHPESIGTPVDGDYTEVLFAADAVKLGLLHLLSRPKLYKLNDYDVNMLVKMLPNRDRTLNINIPTLPANFNLCRQIMDDLSGEIMSFKSHYSSKTLDPAHSKAILELLYHTYSREVVGTPANPVYLVILKIIGRDFANEKAWSLFESFPFPVELSDSFAKDIEGLGIVDFLEDTKEQANVKQQLLATSQLWLFTSLLERQDTDSDGYVHSLSQKYLKDTLVRKYAPGINGKDVKDAPKLRQAKETLVSQFYEAFQRWEGPIGYKYFYCVLRCMLLEENAPESDPRWGHGGTDITPDQLAGEFGHLYLPAMQKTPSLSEINSIEEM